MALPLSSTVLHLIKNVPLTLDYKNTRWFSNLSSQQNYFSSFTKAHSMQQKKFQRLNERNFVDVNRHKDSLLDVNYLYFQNSKSGSKWFYCFVTDLEYKNEGNTRVYFEIDVMQTRMFEINFKPSYVVREHTKLWNSDGSPVVNTLDEGFNFGDEYETVAIDELLPIDDLMFMVIVSKTLLHRIDSNNEVGDIKPTKVGVNQPFTYYIIPLRTNGNNYKWQIGNGEVNGYSPTEVLNAIYKLPDVVNNIVSLYMTEYIGSNVSLTGDTATFNASAFGLGEIAGNEEDIQNLRIPYVKSIDSFSTVSKNLGNKYKDFIKSSESKLLMYPYVVTYLDNGRGDRVPIKNEYIKQNDFVVTVNGALGTAPKVQYRVNRYLFDDISPHLAFTGEHALQSNQPNDLPIAVDSYAAFLQGNRNTLKNQRDMTHFNGMMNLLNSVSNLSRANPLGSAMDVMQSYQNHQFNIESINAKVADIQNQPPSLQNLGTNVNFDFGNGLKGCYIIKKQIRQEHFERLESYFKMYGYKVNQLKIPNIATRQHFNYIQTTQCIITGSFNQNELEQIKQIFNSGITLWHTNDIGNYALANGVR